MICCETPLCLFKQHFNIYIIHHVKEHEIILVIHLLRFWLFKISPLQNLYLYRSINSLI